MTQRKRKSKPKFSSLKKNHPPYILLVEDEPTHSAVIRHVLKSANPNVVVKTVESLKEYRSMIATSSPEIVLMDMMLSDGKALDVLTSPPEAGLFPIVVMTGFGDAKIAAKAMKAGALDYIVKSSETFAEVPRTVERALREWKLLQERKQVEEALRENELRFRTFYENVTIGLYRTTPAGKILLANKTLVKMLGYSSFEKLAERNLSKAGFAQEYQRKNFLRKIESEGEVKDFESAWTRQDGSVLFVHETARAIRDSQGKTLYYDGAVEDITERKLAEAAGKQVEDALRRVSRLYATLSQVNHTFVRVKDREKLFQAICRIAVEFGQFRMAWIGLVDERSGHVKPVSYDGHEAGYLQTITINISKGSPFGKGPSGRAIREGKIVISDNSQVDTEMLPWQNEALNRGYLSSAAVPFHFKGRVIGLLNLYAAESGFFTDEEQNLLEEIGENISFALDSMDAEAERKQAEVTIRENEEIFKHFMEHSPIYVFFKDENIRAIRLSKNYEKMLGKPIAELLGKNMSDLFPSELAKNMVADDMRLLKEGKEIIVDEELNGRYYSTIKFPIIMEGKPRYLAGYTIDITERKRAEEQMLIANERLQYLLSSTSAVIYTAKTSGDFGAAFISGNVAQLVGHDPEEFIRDSNFWYDHVHPEDRLIVSAEVSRIFEKEIHAYEYRFKCRHGGYIWMRDEMKLFRDHNGSPLEIIGFWMDITEHKRAEEALKQSEEKFRQLTEKSIISTYIIQDAKMAYVNPSFAKTFGYSPDEIMGILSPKDLIHSDDIQAVMNRLKERLEGKTEEDPITYKAIRKDGSLIYIEVYGMMVEYQGRPAVMGTLLDITERKRAEKALRESEEKYRSLVEQSMMGIGISRGNQVLFANEALLRIFNYDSLEEFIKIPITDHVAPSSRDLITNRMRMASEGKNPPLEFEYDILCKGGLSRTLYAISIHMSLGGEACNQTIFQDITERKRAEQKLLKLTLRQEAILDAVPDIIMEVDNNKVYTWANKSGIDFFGDDVIGKEAAYYFEGEQKTYINVQPLFNGDENIVYVESWQRRKDGEKRLLAWWCRVLKDENGKVTGVLSSARDLTEYKHAEEVVRQSTERLHLALESANSGAWEWDLLTNENIWSDELWKLYGLEPHSCLPSYDVWRRTIHPDDRENTEKKVQEAAREGSDLNVEWRVVGRDGEVRWLMSRGRPFRDENGKVIRLIGIVLDITERKRVEEALRESENNYRELINGMTETVWIIDLSGNLIDVNKTAVELLGYSKEELLAIGLFGVDSSLKKEDIQALAKAMPTDKIQIFETSHTTKNGKTFPVEVYSSLVTYKGKKAILSIARNITERIQTEERLRQMQKLEGLGTLAGGIAHDFNNILGIILAYTTSIKRYNEGPEKFALATDTIIKAVERGKSLVQQILTFARKTETEFESVNVNDVVMEIMTMILETFPKVLTYSQNFEKGIPCVNADRSQLHQALLNLCVNARDAMPSGGVLTINTRMVSGISLHNLHPDADESSYVCIEVSDTGEGMTEEIKKRIFEPFFTTKEMGKGTGLGLAVVFGVVQTHKGFIDVESEPGKGTIFRLYIPVSQAVMPIILKDEEKLEDIPGGKETLLVVEDEETLLAFLQTALVDKGYTVLSAKDGPTALQIYKEREKEISLVLTDLGLPKITGLEVCQQIKQINPLVHIILATGYLDPEMKSKSLETGVQKILFKPYDLKEVLKVVREIIDEK